MESKPHFIFNLAWYESLKDYAPEVRLEVYEATMIYAATGTPPELKPLAKMAFSFIKKEMDYNTERYQSTLEKRRAACKSRWDKTKATNGQATQPPGETGLPRGDNTSPSFEALQAELLADQAFWDASAMSLKTSVEALKTLLTTFVSEKTALGQTYGSFTDFRHHFFSWSRIAISKNQLSHPNEAKPTDKYSKRRGVDSAAVSPEDYTCPL